MTRILVYPEELQSVSQQFRAAADELRSVRDRFTRAASSCSWSLRSRVSIDQETAAARGQAEALIRMAEELARYASQKAQDFQEADSAGARGLAALGNGAASAFRRALDSIFAGGLRWRTDMERWVRIGKQLAPGVGSLLPVVSLPWLRRPGSGLFPTLRLAGESGGATLPASPAPAPPRTVAPEPSPAPQPEPAPPPSPGRVQVPPLKQDNKEWATETVCGKLWKENGCTLTSIAMVISHYHPGIKIEKQFMLDLRQGVNDEAEGVVWAQADSYLTEKYGLTLEHENMPAGPRSEALTTAMQRSLANLERTPPVPTIFGLAGQPHWVVITGFTGDPAHPKPEDFLINDPGDERHTLEDILSSPKYKGATIDALVTITKKTGQA